MLYNDPNRVNTTPEKMSMVTAADVQRVAATWLKPEKAYKLIVTPAVKTADQAAAQPGS